MLLPHATTSDEMHTRFRVETDAIASLEHRAILPVYLEGEHRGMPFFTMKLATGGTLAARRESLRGKWRAIAELVVTLAEAVQFAHARGVIHRDLKPDNVLVDEAGQPHVSDFGLAKFLELDAHITRTLASFREALSGYPGACPVRSGDRFIIDGTSPKTVLVRAIGPTLAAFSVGGVLADPQLALFSSAGTQLAHNDNGADSLAATFTSVLAFPLTSGSKDAAFLVTLAPGAYTAQVSGVGGTTGEALAEIYEVP